MLGLDRVNEFLRGKQDPVARLEADLARAERVRQEIGLYGTNNGRPLEDPRRATQNTNEEIQRIRLELEKLRSPVIQPSSEGVNLPSAKGLPKEGTQTEEKVA